VSIVDFIEARLDEQERRAAAPTSRDTYWERERTLAQVKANRLLLKLYRDWPILVEEELPQLDPIDARLDFQSMTFRMTQRLAWATNQQYIAHFGTEPPHTDFIRALASVWAEHPDFDPSWRLA